MAPGAPSPASSSQQLPRTLLDKMGAGASRPPLSQPLSQLQIAELLKQLEEDLKKVGQVVAHYSVH